MLMNEKMGKQLALLIITSVIAVTNHALNNKRARMRWAQDEAKSRSMYPDRSEAISDGRDAIRRCEIRIRFR